VSKENILEVKNLVKVYDDGLKAVNDISFALKSGEILGLLGPNGAGKTSTIDMILGLLQPTSGSIKIFGKELKDNRSEILNQLNFAAVYAQLPGNLTVRQNLYIFALMYNVLNPRLKVSESLKEFDLEQFAGVKNGLLSSGEQTRVHIAKAMLNKPRLLLLDEPTASLDPSVAQIMRERIKNFSIKNETAILWTSHDMHEISKMCDRVFFISHGKILLEGDPRKLPSQYGKGDLEELFISVAREPLSLHSINS
jgi:ABC-2 type transport system ATP-binding protein